MVNYRTIDIPSFVSRHVYEFYFNCDYDGPTWTYNLSLDLKIIAAMPVLYPEQLIKTGMDKTDIHLNQDVRKQVSIPGQVWCDSVG